MPSAAIVGTGLIGASIGLGLRNAGWRVAGWDVDERVRREVVSAGAVDEILADPRDVTAAEYDVVVLAGPPGMVTESVAEMSTDALVVDVAGVKGPVISANRLPRFVGTHPMAGRETSGPEAATAALFRGAAWVIVTDGAAEADLGVVEDMVRVLGARPLRMTAAEHDVAVAAISHLPQVVAAALVQEADDETKALDLAAGSFRDLTRVAASDPGVWTQLLTTNRTAVRAAITGLASRLSEVAEALEGENAAVVQQFLGRSQELRLAMAPPVVAIRVALADRPGELARVGRALEVSGVDVRDLQLRHAPHGGGGVLTLSVRHGDGEPLRDALTAEGLVLVE